MPFLHDPISDVQSIANNLRDRYKSGFPILKEIVQNADDAKAENLVIGWHPGIDDAKHPLLRDPGFFFINDAPLTEADVQGIRTLGLGSKADDANAVGKFGLGMKSLFHLGELYFFIGSDWQEYQDKFPKGLYPKADVLNPWDFEREEWNSFVNEDKRAIQQELIGISSAFADDGYKFIVWIPLRSPSIARERGEASNNYIYNSEDYGREVPPFLLEPNLPTQLGKLLPMLKHLRTIKGCSFSPESDVINEHFSTELDTPNNRIIYPIQNGEVQWTGSIGVNRGESDLASNLQINYVGTEVYLNSEPLNQLKQNDFWPISYARDSSGFEKKVEDKAAPHSAVLLLAKPSGAQSKLTVRWAVFLPLGEQDTSEKKQVFETQIEGNMSFDILLHGYFFIDAGRVGIHGRKAIGQQNALLIDSEDAATQEWNRLIANEGSLPLVLKSVSLAAENLKLTQQQKDDLTSGLLRFLHSEEGSSCRHQVTSVKQWVYQITKESNGWALICSSKPIRKLPKPISSEYERVWDTFPLLFSMNDELTFIDDSKSNINAKHDESWQIDELVELLDTVPVSVFESPKHLGYLNSFLFCVTTQVRECQRNLIKLAQTALKEIDLSKLSRNQSSFKEFIGFIAPTYRWAVKVEKDDQTLWNLFSSVDTQKLFIPTFLEKGDSSGSLDFIDADKLFAQLAKQVLTDRQLVKVTDTILESLEKVEKDTLIKQYDNLKLFSVTSPISIKPYRESSRNLNQLFQNGRLFKRANLDAGSYGLGLQLSEALESSEIVFINDKVNQLLFERGVTTCGTGTVLKLLAKRPKLNFSESRKALISKLEITAELSVEERLSVRYLIHGNAKDHDSLLPLWSVGGDDAVWSRLQCESLSEDENWRIVPHELSSALKLDPRERQIINLKEINARTVQEQIGDDIQYIDFTDILVDEHDAEVILKEIEDKDIWCSLPLHKTHTGELVSIESHCFLETSIELPDEIEKSVSWIVPAVSKEVQRQQGRNIAKLDYVKGIELALKHEEPSYFQNFILASLERLESTELIIDALKQSRWLKAENTLFSPSMVVFADKESWPTAYEIAKNSNEFCFAESLDIVGQSSFRNIENLLVSNDIDIARLVLESAAKLSDYAIGEGKVTSKVLSQAQLHRMAFNNVDLKGWELLIECYSNVPEGSLNEAQVNYLTRKLTTSNGLIQAHENLVETLMSAESVCDLRAALLTMICHQPNPLQALAKLKLRSLNDEFVPSLKLCYGIMGASKSSLLHDEDFKSIKSVLPINEDPKLEGETLVKHIEHQNSQAECVKSSAIEIQNYFSSWEPFITNTTAIGAVLALMSGNADIRKLSEDYIGQRTYSNFIGEIGRNWDKTKKTYSSLEKFVSKVQFDIQPEEGSTILEKSIFDELFEVELESDAESVFVWNTTRLFYSGPISVQLRKLPIVDMNEDKLLSILKNSAELFLAKIYQQELTLDHIWDEFSGAEQLDIRAAMLTVMDGIVHQLKELHLNVPELKALLSEYNELLAANAESHQLMDGGHKSQLLTNICDEVQVEDTKKQVLEAIKQKIEQAQYQPSSVPFELFQNADDAVVELRVLGYSDGEVKRRGVFKVNIIDEELTFSNWGREINQYSSKHCTVDGSQNGFKTDLQKMLVRNQSDKGELTTGKFGLGFKSCLLISDSPKIVSGRLAAQIEGGLLPTLSPDHERLFELTKRDKLDGQFRPTIISLPLRIGIHANEVLSRFRKQAGLLTVFSKGIHTIECDGDLFQWTPVASTLINGLSIGSVRIPTKKRSQDITVACVQMPSGSFAFALDENGFKPLSKDVPKLWNLSPLMGDFGIGFAINAQFEVDIGRNQLALSSPKNSKLFEVLGRDVKAFLENLYLTCQSDWPAIRDELGLNTGLDLASFWASVWKSLYGSGPSSATFSGTESTESYIHKLFTSEGCILSFYHSYQAFPANIKGIPQRLVNLASVSYRLGEVADNMLKHIVKLPDMSELLETQKVVGFDTGRSLLSVDVELTTLELDAIADMVLKGDELTPLSAEQLLNVFDSNFEIALKENKATHDQVEQFRRKLSELKVKVENGSYRSLKKALFVNEQNSNRDESMVIHFAPSEYIVSDKYSKALTFLEFCRRDATPYNLEDLYNWICRSDVQDNGQKQRMICDYIVDGRLGEELTHKVKQNFKPSWLFKIDVKHLQNWEWNKKKIDMFRNVRMVTDSEVNNRVESQLRSEGCSRLSTQESLIRIYEWWEEEGAAHLTKYESELYPGGSFDWEAIIQDEQPERYQLAWLKLFFLGSCQTIGRSKEVQHKKALEHFEQKGWWDVFSDPNNPIAWFDVMDQYLLDAVTSDKYRTWLQILPLYRFSNHLDAYIELFWFADNSLPNIDAILRPGSSSDLTGVGSSFAPPELKATLGIGANFILRELYRNNVYSDEALEQHCFVASKGVRDLLSRRLSDGLILSDPTPKCSQEIYQYLCTHLGEDRATFGGSFDIPLRILSRSENTHLLEKILDIGVWSYE